MASIKFVLDRILRSQYDFCCLCFSLIGETNKYYNIRDEIVFSKQNTRNLYELLSCFIGSDVLDNLSESILVCHVCTETAIKSYKFIMGCRKKSKQLRTIIQTLYHYFKNFNKEVNMCKSLILNINSNHIEDHYHDTNLIDKQTDILKILREGCVEEPVQENIQSTSDNDPSIGLDANILNENNDIKKCNQDINLIDIIFDINNPSLFKCKICHNTFSRGPNLKKHYYSIHAPKVFKCSLCPKSFGSAILLKSHQNHHHCTAACCAQCGKVYSSVYTLENHEKRHKTRHICQHCGKIYKTKHAFKTHINEFHCNAERKSKPHFICDYCGKKYAQKSAIRVHIHFQHGNGKFHECEWCKKKFSSISRLNEHIITHTKEKRFSCEQCGGRFATKMSLLYHTRTHTGERPYQCQHCDNSFLSASRRLTHIKQYHMPAAQECDVCHKKFKLRSYLLKHRPRHFNPTSKLHQNA